MPRQYLSPSDLNEIPLGIALSNQIAQLGAGVLDKLLFRASQRADTFCHRRLQAPGTSTLTGNVSPGALSISVASTLTLDNRDEQTVTISSNSGSSIETLPIAPGGVTVTSFAPPYPGTLTLAAPCTLLHSISDPVTYGYQELTEAGHGSSSDPFTEAFTQEAQLAQAHAPTLAKGYDLTRIVHVRNYPIISIAKVEYTYSYDTAYYPVTTLGAIVPHLAAGYYRFRVGTVILPEGFIRTTYTAGFQVVPDDIKDATAHYLADELVPFANPYGALENQQGKRKLKYSDGKAKPFHVQQAEDLLHSYRRYL